VAGGADIDAGCVGKRQFQSRLAKMECRAGAGTSSSLTLSNGMSDRSDSPLSPT
jgi:hypothetical protein